MSLCEVTFDKATKKQRAQAFSVAFGMCVRTSCRRGVSGWRGSVHQLGEGLRVGFAADIASERYVQLRP